MAQPDNRILFLDFVLTAFSIDKNVTNFIRGNMAGTSKDGGLLVGEGIRHVTTTSQLTRGSKQVPACARNNILTREFSAIFCLLARMNILIAAT